MAEQGRQHCAPGHTLSSFEGCPAEHYHFFPVRVSWIALRRDTLSHARVRPCTRPHASSFNEAPPIYAHNWSMLTCRNIVFIMQHNIWMHIKDTDISSR